ncbi:MAG: hypothetical protein V5A31_13765 [Haloferacaceae archaeon]|jgi:hypothetical protein
MDTDAHVDTTVTADRTVVEYSGNDAAAVVVRSVAGERIYLPLVEEAEEESEEQATPYSGEDPGESPYSGAGTAGDGTSGGDETTPYSGGSPGTSPYGGDEGPEPGIHATADGFRVVHPSPAKDVRVLR